MQITTLTIIPLSISEPLPVVEFALEQGIRLELCRDHQYTCRPAKEMSEYPFSDEEAVRLIEMEPPQKRRSNAPVIRHEDSIPTLMTISFLV